MRRLYPLIAAAGLCALFAIPGRSEDPEGEHRREDQIKAGYLFNFTKFVEWPASVPNDYLTICFIGAQGIQNSFAKNLDHKRVGTRRLAVKSLHESEPANGCNVLYVDGKLSLNVFTSFGDLSGPILTVSDARNFTHNGGIISLYTESNRLRFVINIQNASRAKLQISSSLLQLASAVEKGDSP